MRWCSGRLAPRFGTAPTSREAKYLPILGAIPISTARPLRARPMRSCPTGPMAVKVVQAAQPTSRMWSTKQKSGFTLIEVLAVMLIIALVTSLVAVMTPGTGRAKLKALTLEIAALLRRERLGAILTGRDRQVSLDGERRILGGDGGDIVALRRDIVLDILGIDALWSGRQAVVRFHPDGASTGAVLKLSREKAEYEIRVNWYTGGVAVGP